MPVQARSMLSFRFFIKVQRTDSVCSTLLFRFFTKVQRTVTAPKGVIGKMQHPPCSLQRGNFYLKFFQALKTKINQKKESPQIVTFIRI